MYRNSYTLAAIALISVASAQTTTAKLFLVGFDQQSVLGSIVGSDSIATTYALNCGSQASKDCGVPPSFTFTQGPSTLHYVYSVGDSDLGTETIDLGCKITSSDHGACSVTMVGVLGSSTTSSVSTESLSSGGSELSGMIVTITAGAVASSTNTAASTTRSATSEGSSASRAASGSSSSRTSTAGAPMATKAPWLVGGAMGALAYAAI